jgi:hypothetical protein
MPSRGSISGIRLGGAGESKGRRGEAVVEVEGEEPSRYESGTQASPIGLWGDPRLATRPVSARKNLLNDDRAADQSRTPHPCARCTDVSNPQGQWGG